MNKLAFLDGFAISCKKYGVDPRLLMKYAEEPKDTKKPTKKGTPESEVTASIPEVSQKSEYYPQSGKELAADVRSTDPSISTKAMTMTPEQYAYARLLSILYNSRFSEHDDGRIGGYAGVKTEMGRRPIPPGLTADQIKARLALAAREGNRGLDVAPGASYSEMVFDPGQFDTQAQALTPAGTNNFNAVSSYLGYPPDYRAFDIFTGKGQGAFGRDIPLPQAVLRAHETRKAEGRKRTGEVE